MLLAVTINVCAIPLSFEFYAVTFIAISSTGSKPTATTTAYAVARQCKVADADNMFVLDNQFDASDTDFCCRNSFANFIEFLFLDLG